MIANYLFSAKFIHAKLLALLGSFFAWQGTAGVGQPFLERMLNISVALFVMGVGLYVLWKQFQKESEYNKEQNAEMKDLVSRVVSVAENSTQAVKNSTSAMEKVSNTMSKMNDKLDRLENMQ